MLVVIKATKYFKLFYGSTRPNETGCVSLCLCNQNKNINTFSGTKPPLEQKMFYFGQKTDSRWCWFLLISCTINTHRLGFPFIVSELLIIITTSLSLSYKGRTSTLLIDFLVFSTNVVCWVSRNFIFFIGSVFFWIAYSIK